MSNSPPALHWLPTSADWRTAAQAFRATAEPDWDAAVALANSRLDFMQTNLLDRMVGAAFPNCPPGGCAQTVRLAILGSSTLSHLHAGLRMAALRRGVWLTTYEAEYGLYRQELADRSGRLHAFAPTAVLFAFDPWHVSAGVNAAMEAQAVQAAANALAQELQDCWRMAKDEFGCLILQQSFSPAIVDLVGSAEHRLPGSRAGFVAGLNPALRDLADAAGVALVALDARISQDGLFAWHDPTLWLRAKQEVSPAAAPMYGELVVRVIAASQGRSSKCLVLDLDNTLWGGVVGDDGLEGLVLGQGTALGEAFAGVQAYALELSRRGVILAVCSKNDEANAFEAFDRHPEMILRRKDIACFAINWLDKATNLKTIAAELQIGLESLVFLDDNPMERSLVRGELPMVAVPELGEDPAFFPKAISDAGYFEATSLTREDIARTSQYQTNLQRDRAQATATDMTAFLRGLEMELVWGPVDRVNLQRVTQLINKTNQFNLTTRRYTEDEVRRLMADDAVLALQMRLIDKFGDNGLICVVIARLDGTDMAIDTWLMSCRVLGRQVEAATVQVLAEQARLRGAERLVGEYMPSAKNGMVADHYARLGFTDMTPDETGRKFSCLELNAFSPPPLDIRIVEGLNHDRS